MSQILDLGIVCERALIAGEAMSRGWDRLAYRELCVLGQIRDALIVEMGEEIVVTMLNVAMEHATPQ